MTQKEKNVENFLKYGISREVADRMANANYTVSKIQTASKKDFDSILTKDEVDDLFSKVRRQPISDEVYERLVTETELHCCFCWNIFEEKPIIIHHIDEYNKTQDNSFNNLIVLCLNHHGEVHTKREISQQNFSKIRLLTQKESWIRALSEYREGKRAAPGSETKGATQNVLNSPNSIITQQQIGDNYLVNQLEPRLVYFQGDTKPELDVITGLYRAMFIFGSEDGIGLNKPMVEIHFDTVFEGIEGGVIGQGTVSAGKLERNEDQLKKSYRLGTNFLQAGNYLFLETTSRNILNITSLKTNP